MKQTYKIEITPIEAYQIQIALDKQIRRLFIQMDLATEPDEIQWLDETLEACKELAKKLSKETKDF